MKKSAILTVIVGFCLTHWSFTTRTVALSALFLTSNNIVSQSRNLTLDDTIMFKPARYIPNMQTFGFNIGFDSSGIFYAAARPDYRFDIDVIPNLSNVALSGSYYDLGYLPDLNNLVNYYHKYESDTLHKLFISGQSLSIKTGTLVVNTITLPSNTLTSIGVGSGLSLSSGTLITNVSPDLTTAITGSNGVVISGTYPNFNITQKRQESYTGSTNSSGVVTFTFAAFPAVPNIQYNTGFGATNKETCIPNAASTTTSCSFYVQLRADVLGLLPSYSNVNGREVNIIVTEK